MTGFIDGYGSRQSHIITESIAPTGTVLVTNGSTAVVGTTTNFLSWNVGDKFKSTDGVLYLIDAIADNTHLTLHTTYGGSTLSGQSYIMNRINYQIQITIYSGVGDSTTNDVYLKNHCLHFPNDIQFTDSSNNLLYFWIRDPTANPCHAWVKVGDIASSNDSLIYIYYGNSGQTTPVSNMSGINTFLSFDDFENGTNNVTPAGWTSDAYIPVVVTNNTDYVKNGSLGAKFGPDTGGNSNNYSNRSISALAVSKQHAIEFDAEIVVDSANYQYIKITNGTNNCIFISTLNSAVWNYHNGSNWLSMITTKTLKQFYHFKIYDFDFSAYKFSVDIDGINRVNQGSMNTARAQVDAFGFASGGSGGALGGLDNFFVRRNVIPEPANSTWGAEEFSCQIIGVTRDSAGNILGSCIVLLYKASDNSFVASITSDASTGAYSFYASDIEQYFVVAFKAGSPDVQGCSDNNLQGS